MASGTTDVLYLTLPCTLYHEYRMAEAMNVVPLFLVLVLLIPGPGHGLVAGSGVPVQTSEHTSFITFVLADLGDYQVEQISLMKKGRIGQDGYTREEQMVEFLRRSDTILWNPCDGTECAVSSFSGSGGTGGRDQLILNLVVSRSDQNADSWCRETACERLEGRQMTISGMLEGIFHTGRTYTVSVSGLKPGIGESFPVT